MVTEFWWGFPVSLWSKICTAGCGFGWLCDTVDLMFENLIHFSKRIRWRKECKKEVNSIEICLYFWLQYCCFKMLLIIRLYIPPPRHNCIKKYVFNSPVQLMFTARERECSVRDGRGGRRC